MFVSGPNTLVSVKQVLSCDFWFRFLCTMGCSNLFNIDRKTIRHSSIGLKFNFLEGNNKYIENTPLRHSSSFLMSIFCFKMVFKIEVCRLKGYVKLVLIEIKINKRTKNIPLEIEFRASQGHRSSKKKTVEKLKFLHTSKANHRILRQILC